MHFKLLIHIPEKLGKEDAEKDYQSKLKPAIEVRLDASSLRTLFNLSSEQARSLPSRCKRNLLQL